MEVTLFVVGCVLLVSVKLVMLWHFSTKRGAEAWKVGGSRTLITGGSKGIGKALAKELVAKGGSVILVARTESKLLETQKELSQDGKLEGRVHILACDVSNAKAMTDGVARKMQELGWEHLDATVANAGISGAGNFMDAEPGYLERVMNINYWGCVYTIRATIEFLKKSPQQARCLVNGSMFSLVGFAGQSAYVPTKYALRGLCEVLQHEFYPEVIVSIVYPPDVETDQLKEEHENQPPLTRAIQGETETVQPELIATGMLDMLATGNYSCSWTFDGYMLHCATLGMSPASKLLDTLGSVFLGGILRVVGMFYAWSWIGLAKEYNQKSK